MRRLDLLVPAYDEPDETIKPLLDSVAVQRGVDLSQVGVIVCCDGGSFRLSEELASQYPFEIEFYVCEHKGVSSARNSCLDKSSASYVMFCDLDDAFCDTRALHLLFREMDAMPSEQEMRMLDVPKSEWQPGFDYLISNFAEETINRDTGEITYINHDQMDGTFVHGKCWRREWLIENNVRFNPKLVVHEDNWINQLSRAVAKPYRIKWCPFPFYCWCHRETSVCRRSPTYILETYGDMLLSSSELCDELSRRMMHDTAAQYAVSMIYDAFYSLTKRAWRDIKNAEYRANVLDQFKSYYRRHRAKWHSVPDNEKLMISRGVRDRCIMEGDMQDEPITIKQWLVRLGLEPESYINDSKTYL